MKMFTIRGTPQQIDYARQLIEEKIGVSVLTVFWFAIITKQSRKQVSFAETFLPFHCQIT